MGTQVGEAFVRIRPNMTGFKSETETGVRSSFSSLAKIAGLAFGGAAVGELIKSSIESAGQTQAAANAIKETYGKAGDSILDFAKKGGVTLGSFESSTNDAAVQLGQLFKNAGDSGDQAAKMALGWEKLGLAINTIRGGGTTGAAQTLQEIAHAAAGTSTRGLSQLGISLNTASIQAKAVADGFLQIGQSSAGLTPAQKQLVTFQLAMQQLPRLMDQAKSHLGDFASEQARLSVEWNNAKSALGTALLPLVTKYTSELANWLGKAENSGRLQRDFAAAAGVASTAVHAIVSAVSAGVHVWQSFSNAVGGAKHALIVLAAAYGALKLGSIGKAATSDASSIGSRIGATFSNIRSRAKASSEAMQNDFTTASKKIVAQTEAMQTASGKWSVQTSANAAKVKENVTTTSTSFGALDTAIKKSATTTQASTGAMNVAFNDFANNTKSQAGGFRSAITRASSASAGAFEAAMTGMKAAAIELGATIKVALIQTGIGLLVVAIGIAVGYIITHWQTVERYTVALGNAIAATWSGLKTLLLGIAESIGGGMATYLTLPIRAALEVIKHIVDAIPNSILGISTGVSGLKSGLSDALGFLDKGTTDLATKGVENVKKGAESIFSGARDAWNKSLHDSANDPKTKDAAKTLGKNTAKNVVDGVTQGVTALAPAVQKTISDALTNAVDAAHKAIQASVQSAKDNLDKIGQDLAKTIDEIQQKIGGAAGAIAGSPQGQAFAKLKKLIESGAPAFEIQKAQAELSGQLKGVGTTQAQQVSTQLANLTAAFDKGQIGYKEFEDRLHKILHDDGITLGQALKAGGPAFADAFKAQVGALGKQAKAISDIPRRFRGIGGAGGAADLKIIQPLQIIKQEQLKVRTAVEKAAQEAAKQRAAILKAQQKQATIAEGFKAQGIKVHWDYQPGTVNLTDAHHHRELLGKIHENTKPTHVSDVTRASVRNVIQTGHASMLRALREVCADIVAADKDIVASNLALHSPLEALRRTELRIGDDASQQRDRQLRATQQTNTLLRKLERTRGPLPGFHKARPGTGGKHARKANKAGVKI